MKKKLFSFGIFLLATVLLVADPVVAQGVDRRFFNSNDIVFYGDDACGPESGGSAAATGSSNDGGMNDGWPDVNSASYKNAQTIGEFFRGNGFSGAGIAGVISNVMVEGGLSIPDRAQGHFGSDPATNGIAAGVVPKFATDLERQMGGAGGGFFQITPYMGYAPLGHADWLDIDKQFKWLIANKTDLNGDRDFAEVGKQTDPVMAAKYFFVGLEFPGWNLSSPETAKYFEGGSEDHTKHANEVYDTLKMKDGTSLKDIKTDIAKLNAFIGGDGSEEGAADTSNTSCGDATTGSIDDLLGLARGFLAAVGFESSLQPDKVAEAESLTPGNASIIAPGVGDAVYHYKRDGWFQSQCTAFTAYFLELYGEYAQGNGADMVDNSGLEKSPVPIAGGIFSWKGGYGHTGVVVAVEDGVSFTTMENNVSGGMAIVKRPWSDIQDSGSGGWGTSGQPMLFTVSIIK